MAVEIQRAKGDQVKRMTELEAENLKSKLFSARTSVQTPSDASEKSMPPFVRYLKYEDDAYLAS